MKSTFSELLLEVAKDETFRETILRNTTKNTNIIVQVPATDGTLFWRLSISGQGRVLWKSPVRQFSLTSALRQPAGH